MLRPKYGMPTVLLRNSCRKINKVYHTHPVWEECGLTEVQIA
jgi:hypothetical protein